MSEQTKEEKRKTLDAIEHLDEVLRLEIEKEIDLSTKAQSQEETAHHTNQQIELGMAKSVLLKLKAKVLMK